MPLITRSMGAAATLVSAAIAATACAPPPVPEPTIEVPEVVIGATRQVLPGPGVPADAPLGQANNNLDVLQHDGSVFLAIRTSLVHFATPWTRIVVFRSDDGGDNWATEQAIDRGRDMREPRLLALDGSVFLYFFEAGTDPLAFQPGRIFATRRDSAADWTEPIPISPDDSVVWRTKWLDGRPLMMRYQGGSDTYTSGEPSIDVEMLTTHDGFEWEPWDESRPIVHTGGVSETDLALDADGDLWAIGRNEAGERGRYGSVICSAPSDDITDWTCTDDPRKFDSPLVFSHRGEIWLLARRQVANEGRFDLGLVAPRDVQYLAYEAAYWITPKRLALWKLDRATRTVNWVADLPSRGDTAFPGIVWTGPDTIDVYNYSSPIGGDDLSWVAGQLGPTNIYVTPVTLPS